MKLTPFAPRLIATVIMLVPLGLAALGCAEEMAARDDRAAEQLGWHLATKCYTFRALTLVETLAITKRLGLKYIEINPGQKFSTDQAVNTDHNSSAELRAAIKRALAEHGVAAVCFGVTGLGKDETADRKVFDYARDLGIQTIVSEPPAEAFATLDKLCAEYGINVAIHNHPEPSPYWNPETVLSAITGHHARIGSCSDTGHWARSALTPTECLGKLAGHVISLHFKDTDKIGKGARDVPLGTGKADVKGMLSELKKQGFKGVFSLEYESGASGDKLIAEVQQSIAYFDGIARELAAQPAK